MSLTAQGEATFTVKIDDKGIEETKTRVGELEEQLNRLKNKTHKIKITLDLPAQKDITKLNKLYKDNGPLGNLLKKNQDKLSRDLKDMSGQFDSKELAKQKQDMRTHYEDIAKQVVNSSKEIEKAKQDYQKAMSSHGFENDNFQKDLEKKAKIAAEAYRLYDGLSFDGSKEEETKMFKYADDMMSYLSAMEAYGEKASAKLRSYFGDFEIGKITDTKGLSEFHDVLAKTVADIYDLGIPYDSNDVYGSLMKSGTTNYFKEQLLEEAQGLKIAMGEVENAKKRLKSTQADYAKFETERGNIESTFADSFKEDIHTGASLVPEESHIAECKIKVTAVGLDDIETRINALKNTEVALDISDTTALDATVEKVEKLTNGIKTIEDNKSKATVGDSADYESQEPKKDNSKSETGIFIPKEQSTIPLTAEIDETNVRSQIELLTSSFKKFPVQLSVEFTPKIPEIRSNLVDGLKEPIQINLDVEQAQEFMGSLKKQLDEAMGPLKGSSVDKEAQQDVMGKNFLNSVNEFVKNKKRITAEDFLASKKILDESENKDFIKSMLRKRIKPDGKKSISIGKALDGLVKEAESKLGSSQDLNEQAIEKRRAEILSNQKKGKTYFDKTPESKPTKQNQPTQKIDVEVDPASIDTALSKIQEAQSKPIRIDVEPNVDGFYEKVYDAVQEQKKKFENDIRDKAYQDYLDNDPEYKKALQERNAFESKSRSMDQYSSFDTYKSNTKKTDKVVDLRNAVREYMAGKNEGKISDDVYKKLFASADRSLFSSKSQKGLYSELVKGLSVFDGKEAHSLSPDDVRALVQSALVDYQKSKKYGASKDSVRDKALGIYKDMPGYEDIIAMRKGVAQQEAAKFRKVKSDFDAFKASDSGSIIAQKQMEASVAASKAVKENGILSSLIPDLDKLKSEPIKLTIDVDASQVDSLLQSLETLETKFGQINAKKSEIENTPIRELADNIDENKNLISPDIQLSPDALANVNNAIKGLQIEPIKIDLEPQTDGFYDRLLNSVKDGKKKYQDDILDSWAGYSLSENKEYQKAMREKSKWEAESAPKLEGITNVSKFKQETTKGMKTQQFMKAFEDYVIEWGSKSAKEISKETYENLLGAMDASFFNKDAKGFLKAIQPAIHTRDGNGGFQYFNHDEIMQMAGEALSGYIEAYKGDFDKSLKDVTDKDYDKILKSAGVKEKRVQNQKARSDVIKPITNAYDEGKRIDKTIRDFEEGANREAKEKAKVDPLSDALTSGIDAYIAQEKTLKFKADLSQVEQALAKLQGKEIDLKVKASEASGDGDFKKSGSKGKKKKGKQSEVDYAEEIENQSKQGFELLDYKQSKALSQSVEAWRTLDKAQESSENMIRDMQIQIRDAETGIMKNVAVGSHLEDLRSIYERNMSALGETGYKDPDEVIGYYKNVLSALKEYDSIMKSPLPKGANSLGSLLFTGANDKSLPVIERTKNDIEEISKQLRDKGFSGVEVSEAPRRNRSDGTSQSYKVKYKDGDNYKEGIVSKSDYTSGSGSSMARYDMRETRVRDASPMKNWANQVKHKIQSLSAYYVSDYILDAGMQQLREGYQFVSDLDSALTNISMTMNTSSQSLSNLGKSAIQTGVDLSTNASNVLEAVTIYANANETTDSILEKATPTLMLANASGDSAANASNYLQAVVNQFDGMEGQEKRIVNSYEKISAGLAMDFSQGISGMAEAVTNAGSVASEAGFSFEEFSAITGSIAEKTRQDFGSIGNTLKTTFARISRAKSADPDVTEKDRSQAALAYKEVAGIDLYDKKGQLKNMPDTLDELAAKWNELTDAQKNNVAEASAGTRGVNVFKAMISSWAEAQQLAKEAVEDTGFADTVQEKWENSLQGHTEKLKATMQGTFANVVDSGVLDTIMSVGQGALGIIEKLTGAIGALGGAINSTGLLGGSVISAMLDGLVAFSAWNTVTNKKDGKSWGESISAGFAPFTQGFGLLKKGGKAGLGFLKSLKPYKDDQYAGWLKDENGEYITEYGEKVWGELPSQGGWTSDFLKNMKKSKEAFVKAKAEGKSMTESVAALGDNATVMQKTAARAGSVLSSTLGSTLAIGGLAVGGALLVNKLADDHQKEAANAGRAALQNYQTNQKTLRTNKSYTEAVLPRLTELQQGVNTRTGDNVSLTEAEFAEYNNIVNELGNMFPSLVTGYSRLGNSILNMGNTISGVSDQIDNQAVKFAKENIATADKSLAVWEEVSTGNWLEQTAKKVQEFFGNDDAFDVDKNMVSSLGQYNVLQKALQLNKGQLKDFLEGKDIEGLDKFQRTMLNNKFGEGSMWTGKKIDTSNEQWYENLKSEMAGLQETLLPAITEATAAMRSQYLSQLDVARLDKELGVKGIPESTWDNLSTFLSGMSTEQIKKLQQDNISPSDFVKSWTDALSGANFKDVNSALTSLLQLGSQSSFKEVENFANNGLKVLTDNIKGLDASSLYDMMGVTNFGKLDQARKDITKSYAEDYGRTDQYLKDSTEYMRLTAKSAESIQRASADQIREAGYNYEGGDSDMFTRIVRGYSKETEGMRAVVNPVLPDGTIMDKDTLADYVTDVLSGAREDEEGIILSAFKTKDAQKAAEAYKKKIDAVGKSLDKNANASKTINELLSDLKIDANEDSIYRLGEMLSRYGGDIEKLKRNWSADSWDYNAELERIEALKAKIEDVKEYYKSMSTARDEANSASGMSTDSIDYVKSMYSRLKGYNQEELFENTAMGVNLYAKAARNLHKEWKDSTAKEYQQELDSLCDTYATLNKQLAEAKKEGKSESNLQYLMDQIGDVSTSIDQVHQLQSQFEGVSNEVYEWQQAQSGSERGDIYDSMISGYKSAKELYEAGDIDTNKFRTFVNMLTNKDLTNADPTEVVEAYERSVGALDRWLGDDAYGNLNNFIDDLHGLGDDFARLDANDVWHLNEGEHSLKEIAKQLDISDAALNAFFGKLQDQGFDISYQDNIDYLQQMRETAKSAQKELQKTGKVKDLDIDWGAESIDDLQKNIDKLEKQKIKLNAETDGDEISQLQSIIDYFASKQGIKFKVEMESNNEEAVEALTKREDRVNEKLGTKNKTNYASSSANEYESANQNVYEAIQKRESKKLTSAEEGYSDTRAYVLDNINRAFENTQQDAWWYEGFENQTQGFRDSIDAAKEMIRLKDKYSKMQEAKDMGLELDPKEFSDTAAQYQKVLDDFTSHVKDSKLKEALKEVGVDADKLISETAVDDITAKMQKGLENKEVKAKIAAEFDVDESEVDFSKINEILGDDKYSDKQKYELLVSLGLSENEIEEYLNKDHAVKAKVQIENEKGFEEFNEKYNSLTDEQKEEIKQAYNLDTSDLEDAETLLNKIKNWSPGQKRSLLEFMGFDKSEIDSLMQKLSESESDKKRNQFNADYDEYHDRFVGSTDNKKDSLRSEYGLTGGETESKFMEKLGKMDINKQRDALKRLQYSNEQTERMLRELNPEANQELISQLANDYNKVALEGGRIVDKAGIIDKNSRYAKRYNDEQKNLIDRYFADPDQLFGMNAKERATIADANLHFTDKHNMSVEDKKQYIDYVVGDDPTAEIEKKRLTIPLDMDFKTNDYKKKLADLGVTEEKHQQVIVDWVEGGKDIEDMAPEDVEVLVNFLTKSGTFEGMENEEIRKTIEFEITDNPQIDALEREKIILQAQLEVNGEASLKEELAAAGITDGEPQQVIIDFVKGNSEVEDMNVEHKQIVIDYLKGSGAFEGMDEETITKVIDYIVGDKPDENDLQLDAEAEVDYVMGSKDIPKPDPIKVDVEPEVSGAGKVEGALSKVSAPKINVEAAISKVDTSKIENTDKTVEVKAKLNPDKSALSSMSPVNIPAKLNVDKSGLKTEPVTVQGHVNWGEVNPPKVGPVNVPIHYIDSAFTPSPKTCDCTIRYIDSGWTPPQGLVVTATINYVEGTTYSADGEKSAGTIDYKKGSVYDPSGKVATGTINYRLGSVAVPNGKVATGTINYRLGSVASPGKGRFNGTAHFADGTAHATARAFASGNWGVPSTGPALVGELGQEGVVRDGKFFTIGDNGAEVVNLRRGDVVFNHKQVEELLKNGYVTSNGGRARLVGAAYADGTAKDGMRAFVSVKPSGGGSRHITKYSQIQVASKPAQTYNPPAQVSAAPAQAAAKAAEEYKETLDEIEILIDRIERKIDQLDTVGNSSFTVLADRQSALGEEFAKVTEEINIQTQAVQKYQDYANSLGLDAGWAEKIRNGALNIETITDENLHKTIQEYQEWYFYMPLYQMNDIRILLNCWKTLKIFKPKQKDETSLNGTVMKIEKIEYMEYGAILSSKWAPVIRCLF